jgi:O-antigen/teichoic acid export membrane protein
MKLKRTIKNILSASLSQIITLAIAILLPRLYIVNYGSETNGLLSSVSQIFGYFALLEAGVGAATQQALYKYIGKEDKNNINGILSATNYFYLRTGFIYFLLVVIVAIIYPFVVPSALNHWMVTGTIILIGSGSSINFWFQGKYKVLLTAEGKDYINTNVSMIATTVTNIIKIVLLLCGYNIIIIQIGYLFVSIAQAVFYTVYIKKYYKWIDLSIKPLFSEISQSKNVLVHQVTSLVFNNTDVLLLTFVCKDLRRVSLYTIYGLIYNNIDNITTMVHSAYQPLLGQLYFEDKKRFQKIFECSEVYYMAFSYTLYFCAFVLTPWFVNIYTRNADMSYSDVWIPVLFVAMKLLAQFRRPLMGIINIAGDFKNTQGRTIIEMLLNLGISLLLVRNFSIYGVLFGTIIALGYRCIDVLYYVPKYLIEHKRIKTVYRWGIYLLFFVLGTLLWNKLSIPNDSILLFFVYAIVVFIISAIVFGGVGSICNIKELKTVMEIILKKAKKNNVEEIK